MLGILHILVLNDLSDAPHKLFIKCFASRQKEKERSFKKLFESSWKQLNASLLHIFTGMRSIYVSAQEGEDMMKYELTPEIVMEIGKGFEDAFLAFLPIDKRLKGLKPEDIFARFKPEDMQLCEFQKINLPELQQISTTDPVYYILSVNEFNDYTKDTLDEWIYFLKHSEIKDEFKAKGIHKASEELDFYKLSKEERRQYEPSTTDV